MNKTNEVIQWAGAAAIISMHVLNAVGPSVYPWNVVAAVVGTVLFLAWCIRVRNAPQFTLNAVTLVVGFVGLYRAFG